MKTVRGPLVGRLGELVLIAALLIAWVVTWLAIDGSLEGLTPGGQALYLVNSFTDERITIALVLGLVLLVFLPLRHYSPVGALLVVGALGIALQWFYPVILSGSVTVPIAVGITIFWVTWKIRNWWGWVALVLIPFISASGVRTVQTNQRFEAFTNMPSSTSVSVSVLLQELLFFAVIILAGLGARRIVEQQAELEERNRELVAERARASEAAVLDERLRISRELHDVVAHHVSAMTLHAGVARQLVDSDPEQATESLRDVESAGRNAVSELHQLLGFLRSADSSESHVEDRSPTPSLRHLGTLQDSFGPKLNCEVDVVGDLSQVPSAVDLSAYRIIQEALTNTVKHSKATEVDVTLDVAADSLTVSVEDKGPARVGTGSPGGHGLVGMAERTSLHGGELTAGEDETGSGWHVLATLPFAGLVE